MFGLGLQELIIILVIIIILFGAKRLPELAEGMGKAIKNFKKASTEDEDNDINVTPKKCRYPRASPWHFYRTSFA